jgi:hypothetical protein
VTALDDGGRPGADFLTGDVPPRAAQHRQKVAVAAADLEDSPRTARKAFFEPPAAMLEGGICELPFQRRRGRIVRGVVVTVEDVETALGDAIVETFDAAAGTDGVTAPAYRAGESNLA